MPEEVRVPCFQPQANAQATELVLSMMHMAMHPSMTRAIMVLAAAKSLGLNPETVLIDGEKVEVGLK